MRRPVLALLAAAMLAAPAAAAPVRDWNKGTPVDITITNDRFVPSRITLRRGAPYILRIRNASDRRHNLSAPQFFGHARVAPGDARWVSDDKVDLRAGERARVRIVAPTTPNTVYDYRSTNLLDAAEKLKGQIYVR